MKRRYINEEYLKNLVDFAKTVLNEDISPSVAFLLGYILSLDSELESGLCEK